MHEVGQEILLLCWEFALLWGRPIAEILLLGRFQAPGSLLQLLEKDQCQMLCTV